MANFFAPDTPATAKLDLWIFRNKWLRGLFWVYVVFSLTMWTVFSTTGTLDGWTYWTRNIGLIVLASHVFVVSAVEMWVRWMERASHTKHTLAATMSMFLAAVCFGVAVGLFVSAGEKTDGNETERTTAKWFAAATALFLSMALFYSNRASGGVEFDMTCCVMSKRDRVVNVDGEEIMPLGATFLCFQSRRDVKHLDLFMFRNPATTLLVVLLVFSDQIVRYINETTSRLEDWDALELRSFRMVLLGLLLGTFITEMIERSTPNPQARDDGKSSCMKELFVWANRSTILGFISVVSLIVSEILFMTISKVNVTNDSGDTDNDDMPRSVAFWFQYGGLVGLITTIIFSSRMMGVDSGHEHWLAKNALLMNNTKPFDGKVTVGNA